MKKCFYCGSKIEKKSKEHIINNALGGLLESEEICCATCNNKIREIIDDDFTKIFSPIVGRIKNMKKTNKTNSNPTYEGFGEVNGKKYNVLLKDGKIIQCKQLNKELKRNLTKKDFDKINLIGYKFNVENKAFKQGIAKIACNFAIESGIPKGIIKKGLSVKKENDKLESVNFNYSVLPFVPLNSLDYYLELATSLELYHNLILFNIANELFCYIDLFNTFQYYVCLSNEFEGEICVSYAQMIEKMDRKTPIISVRKPKNILTYSQMYNVDPTMDLNVLQKRINEKVQKAPYKRDISEIIKCKVNFFEDLLIESMDQQVDYLTSLQFYVDDDIKLRNDRFRIFTPYVTDEQVRSYMSYPHSIFSLVSTKELRNIKEYTFEKFERLNQFLCYKSL